LIRLFFFVLFCFVCFVLFLFRLFFSALLLALFRAIKTALNQNGNKNAKKTNTTKKGN